MILNKSLSTWKSIFILPQKWGIRLEKKLIAYGNLGCIYSNLVNFKQAIEYHKQCLSISQEIREIRLKKDVPMEISTLPTTVLVILASPFGTKRGLFEEHQNWEVGLARDGSIAILKMPIKIRVTLKKPVSTNSKKPKDFQ